jgi:nicotinamide mononucleotide (NMN) deamidase PncC
MQAGVEQIFGDYLRAHGNYLCTAESCTGGLVGHLLTNVAGSSAYYVGGVIAYANEVKRRVLGVPQEILATYGAVSSQTAIAMAGGQAALWIRIPPRPASRHIHHRYSRTIRGNPLKASWFGVDRF